MHQRSHSELQGVSTGRGAPTQRTIQDRASWSSKPRSRGHPRLCPQSGAHLWAWLLLAALVVPGAWSYLSEEQEELLVELHNFYRGQVSPSASAMMPLKWDPNLKVIAEGYAAQCVWSHNPTLGDTGENLFAGTGPLDLRVAMEKWFLASVLLQYYYTNTVLSTTILLLHTPHYNYYYNRSTTLILLLLQVYYHEIIVLQYYYKYTTTAVVLL
ncbi:Peptidase inhibitor 16 [Larimichthys crocea]|nr:Peptidase inhibitor 16 [Larimichthys crocea]